MVRLVFRPYTQVGRSICTSESLRTSTRVSPGFVLARHRSPSFGSQRVRSGFVRPAKSRLRTPRECARFGLKKKRRDLPSQNTFFRAVSLSLRLTSFDCDSTTRAHVRLLGPCFKTGRVGPDFYSPLWASTSSEEGRSLQVTTGQDCSEKNPAPGEEREPESQHSTPGNRGSLITAHPVGRGVLLGPPLAAGGRREKPAPRRPRKEIGSKRARRPHNGSGDTFRPSRAHPFNPLNGFTHY